MNADAKTNIRLRRGALLVEIFVVCLYEHVSHPWQVSLLVVALTVGAAAMFLFLSSPKRQSEEALEVELVGIEENTDEAYTANRKLLLHSYLEAAFVRSCAAQVTTVSCGDYRIQSRLEDGDYFRLTSGTCSLHGRELDASLLSIGHLIASHRRKFSIELRAERIMIHLGALSSLESEERRLPSPDVAGSPYIANETGWKSEFVH